MRTTIDLPDELLQQAKIAAVQRGSSLRDLVAVALRRELASPSAQDQYRAALPVVRLAEDAPFLRMRPEDLKLVLEQDDEESDLAGAG